MLSASASAHHLADYLLLPQITLLELLTASLWLQSILPICCPPYLLLHWPPLLVPTNTVIETTSVQTSKIVVHRFIGLSGSSIG